MNALQVRSDVQDGAISPIGAVAKALIVLPALNSSTRPQV